jgi:hypothetical protein
MEHIILPLKSKIVTDTLLAELDKNFAHKGFVLKKTKKELFQKTDYGFNSAGLATRSHFPVYLEVGLVFCVRHDKIEDIYSKFDDSRFGNYTKAGIKDWSSHSGRVSFSNHYTTWNYDWIKDFEEYILESDSFVVVGNEHLERAKAEFVKSFEAFAIPFFEKYNNIEAIAAEEIKKFSITIQNNHALPLKQAMYLLIVLKLTNHPRYDNYVEEILKKLSDQKKNPEIKKNRPEQEQALFECIEFLQGI